MSNITQVVNVDKNMTSFKKGVHASDLDQLLSSTGPFTVFVPSNTAFGKLEAGVMENLLKPENKSALTSLLNHHVVKGKHSFKDLKDGDNLKTLSGRDLLVSIENTQVCVDGVAILNHDVQTSNGIIHAVDAVLNN